jgi:hypothetical protein
MNLDLSGASCAKVGNVFINMYNHDNKPLMTGDECYFMFMTNGNYHRPLLGAGIIIDVNMDDMLHNTYMIMLTSILEDINTRKKHLYNKNSNMYMISRGTVSNSSRIVSFHDGFDFSNWCFKVDAFFTREKLDDVTELRKYYLTKVRDDIMRMRQDIDEILNHE